MGKETLATLSGLSGQAISEFPQAFVSKQG